MRKLASVLPTRIVHRNFSGFSRYPCSSLAEACPRAPAAARATGSTRTRPPPCPTAKTTAPGTPSTPASENIRVHLFHPLHQQFAHAALIGDLRGEFQTRETPPIRPPPAPRRADASASRPSSPLPPLSPSAGNSRRKSSSRIVPFTRQWPGASFSITKPSGSAVRGGFCRRFRRGCPPSSPSRRRRRIHPARWPARAAASAGS